MELDDLKQTWAQVNNNNKPKNTDIMNLIQHKSYGPVAALKRQFKKQMILMLLLPVFITATNMSNIEKTLTSVLFWSYVAFCIGIVVFARFNYREVSKMEEMDGRVKSNLAKQVTILETRLKWLVNGLRVALLFFVALTEVLPYFQDYKMLNTWISLHPLIRFGTYAALFAIQYFIGRKMIERKFGAHVRYLKQLVKEME